MDECLQIINKEYISLPVEESKVNNNIRDEIIKYVKTKMVETDHLFNELFKAIFHGGSIFDKIKISKPDEYDIDFLLVLPDSAQFDLESDADFDLRTSNKAGHVNLKFKSSKNIRVRRVGKVPFYGVIGLNKIIDKEHYLSTEKCMVWFTNALARALRNDKIEKHKYSLPLDCGTYKAAIRRKGPAVTIKINQPPDLAIDLVPCFVFDREEYWPKGFRKNNFPDTPSFFIVPKHPNHDPNFERNNLGFRYWRTSFQQQERIIMNSKATLKPTLKLIKKLTKKYPFQNIIPSYYLKTVILWEVEKQSEEFWKNSLSSVFLMVLKVYEQCITNVCIKYYWHSKYNLLENAEKINVYHVSLAQMVLHRMLEDIEKYPDKGMVVAKYILTKREFKEFKLQHTTK